MHVAIAFAVFTPCIIFYCSYIVIIFVSQDVSNSDEQDNSEKRRKLSEVCMFNL